LLGIFNLSDPKQLADITNIKSLLKILHTEFCTIPVVNKTEICEKTLALGEMQ
jgi:hypothetical protein